MQKLPKKILFVCLSNICRSVALQALFDDLVKKKGLQGHFSTDSCGLGWWHLGEDPDPRLLEILKAKGIETEHKAREFEEGDFKEFDYIIAVTKDILKDLHTFAKKEEYQKKLFLACDFSKSFQGQDMEDPYYGFKEDFTRLVAQGEEICLGLLKKIN